MDEISDSKVFATFDRLEEFKRHQDLLLAVNLWEEPEPEERKEEYFTLQKWSALLHDYQEQSYLLDPFLEQLVTPVVECLKTHAKQCNDQPNLPASCDRVSNVAMILYGYIKFRGYKMIIRFFPHEIADLSIALGYMQAPGGLVQKNDQWALRYVILLWLHLICIIPFDLSRFDEPGNNGRTAEAIQDVAKSYLGRAGLERDAAALLLSRVFVRNDAGSRFHHFVEWSKGFLQESNDVFTVIGLLQVLCEVAKTGSAEGVQSELPDLLTISNIIQQSSVFSINTVVRKYRIKLVSRVALRLLPGRTGRRRQARPLAGGGTTEELSDDQVDVDVPEEVESLLEQLFEALQDKDTVVRWSAAKGVARVAERLPVDLSTQVLETVIGLFEIHSIVAATLYDLPAIAESTWHGACLACAELARRNLVEPDHLPKLIEWLSKALYFDLRKGAHSIGSNVRDAAAYVLWALARTQNQRALVPHANNLALRLATVALFDREIHIRRAASAAFQEHVGRTNLFPHGIDVLGKIDFYAVSVRKNAFLVAAPQVAEHAEYRTFLFDHIVNVLLRHWDISMRELGSQSLRLICFHDPSRLPQKAISSAAGLLGSLDNSDIHGGLLALTEIAIGYRDVGDNDELETHLRAVFKYINSVPESTLSTSRNELVTAGVCRLIAHSISASEIQLGDRSSAPSWRKVVDVGLRHRHPIVQEAAAEAMAAMSNLMDWFRPDFTCTLIEEMKSGSPIMQQSLARVLSVINYDTHPAILPQSVVYLLNTVGHMSKCIPETRRSCFQAMPLIFIKILPNLATRMSSDVVISLMDALLGGLNDYTIDERGDVGSWIRIVCIQGLAVISELLLQNAHTIPNFESYLPPYRYHEIAAGILKQGVERLDNVRQEAGKCFLRLLSSPAPSIERANSWRLPGYLLLKELFTNSSDEVGWNDATQLFPRAFRLLEIPEFRKPVLSGLVLSIGSKTDSIQRPVANSLVYFAQNIPLTQGSTYSLIDLVADLIEHAKANMTSNTIVIPVLQAFNVLLEHGALGNIPDEQIGLLSLRALQQMVTKNIDRMKNVQRIHESMKVAINMLAIEPIREESITLLNAFLTHPFPRIRADAAEYLFNLLQTTDFGFETEDVEQILLETEWSSGMDVAREKSTEIIELFENSKYSRT